MPTIDLHQHLWPEQLVAALGRRREAPRLEGSLLELPGAPAQEVDLDAHALEARLALLDRHGIDVAVVSLSPTLGFEDLPGAERDDLVAAWESGIEAVARAMGGRIVGLSAGGTFDAFPGACVGAGRLVALDALAPLLDELERRRGFLFVHPGPASQPRDRPGWWTPIVQYAAELQTAYAAWLADGAARWPRLRVVFASLAGGGPFHHERLRSFGVGSRELRLDNVFLETSSYGTRALELCLSGLGVERLVFGSDFPVLPVEEALNAVRSFGNSVAETLCEQNPTQLLP